MMATSATAKDTYTLFGGNVLASVLGFLFTLVIARALSVEEFGVFSAATNMVVIMASLSDFGVSTGVINFASDFLSRGERKKASLYIKAAFVIKLTIVLIFASVLLLIAPFAAKTLLATQEVSVTYWVALVAVSMTFPTFFPKILQARKEFLKAVLVDNTFYLLRLGFAVAFFLAGVFTLNLSLGSFLFAAAGAGIFGFVLVGLRFLKTNPRISVYKELMKFSGWLGVNKIISSVSGRLDIQMLAAFAGATVTGLYSIPSKLASFVMLLNSSFSSVLATRLAGFNDKEKERVYILKATLALLPIAGGIVFWILIAHPFVVFLFGEKYMDAVPIFQALAAGTIPFLFAGPSVTAIIYAIKKPKFIGIFAFFQASIIFVLNYLLIPRFGAFGPAITLATTYTFLAIYTWVVVVRHYWFDK